MPNTAQIDPVARAKSLLALAVQHGEPDSVILERRRELAGRLIAKRASEIYAALPPATESEIANVVRIMRRPAAVVAAAKAQGGERGVRAAR